MFALRTHAAKMCLSFWLERAANFCVYIRTKSQKHMRRQTWTNSPELKFIVRYRDYELNEEKEKENGSKATKKKQNKTDLPLNVVDCIDELVRFFLRRLIFISSFWRVISACRSDSVMVVASFDSLPEISSLE